MIRLVALPETRGSLEPHISILGNGYLIQVSASIPFCFIWRQTYDATQLINYFDCNEPTSKDDFQGFIQSDKNTRLLNWC